MVLTAPGSGLRDVDTEELSKVVIALRSRRNPCRLSPRYAWSSADAIHGPPSRLVLVFGRKCKSELSFDSPSVALGRITAVLSLHHTASYCARMLSHCRELATRLNGHWQRAHS